MATVDIRQSITVNCPDTWIESGNPFNNHGGDTSLFVGNYGAGNDTRILIEWPIASGDVPAGSQIHSAEIAFKVVSAAGSASPMRVYRTRRDDVNFSVCSWTYYKFLTAWGSGGCSDSRSDYYIPNYVSDTLDTGAGAWWTIPGFALQVMDAMADDRVLRQILRLVTGGGSSNYMELRSGNYATAADRPFLHIHFTPPPDRRILGGGIAAHDRIIV